MKTSYNAAGRLFGIVFGSLLLFTSCLEYRPDIGAWIDEQLAKARESNGGGEEANEEEGEEDDDDDTEPSDSSQVVILGTDIAAAELITMTVTGNSYNVEFTRADGSPCSDSSLDKTDVPIDYKTILDGISGNIAVAIVGDSGNSTTPLKLHLKDVNLAVNRVVSGEPLPAIRLKGNSGIYPNVELIIEGANNKVVSNGVSTSKTHAGIFVPKGSKINIHGIDGNVSANKLIAKGNNDPAGNINGAGIGGCRDTIEKTAMAGSITIGSGVTVEARGGRGAAGIGGGQGYDGGSEKIKIEGNAVVYAYGIYGGPGIGIGKNANTPSHTTVIEIAGEAYVYASGREMNYDEGAGIGVGYSASGSRLNAEIKIGGNAYVFAQGGDNAAGIGTGYTTSLLTTRNLTLTIGSGSDNPVVAAIAGPSSNCLAIGYSGDSLNLDEQNNINITINSGFVIAKANSSNQIIGKASYATGSYLKITTKITGGSVWVDNFNPNCINPPAKNAADALIYPLYMPNMCVPVTNFWDTTSAKTIIVPLPSGGTYSAKTANSSVKAFINSVNTLFGAGIPNMDTAAVLWLPQHNSYYNIEISDVTETLTKTAMAEVSDVFPSYSSNPATNKIF
ncbi:MAG: hypothetical protein Ta2F_01760 [Termitinemataceae bacterium]|nr:MAG: hypothetical protein Ta2F_01760 [Termitinemataceae bacterium]